MQIFSATFIMSNNLNTYFKIYINFIPNGCMAVDNLMSNWHQTINSINMHKMDVLLSVDFVLQYNLILNLSEKLFMYSQHIHSTFPHCRFTNVIHCEQPAGAYPYKQKAIPGYQFAKRWPWNNSSMMTSSLSYNKFILYFLYYWVKVNFSP